MADLEELALKRDRGYLVRLVVLLLLGVGASAWLWRGLTGEHVSGCLVGAFLGEGSGGAASSPAGAK